MAKRGGKRVGAGRKPGEGLPRFSTYWKDEEIKDFFEYLKKRARKSDKIAIFVGEHLFGKATQPVLGENGEPLTFVITKFAKCGHCDKD